MKKVLRRTMCFMLAAVMALAMVVVCEVNVKAAIPTIENNRNNLKLKTSVIRTYADTSNIIKLDYTPFGDAEYIWWAIYSIDGNSVQSSVPGELTQTTDHNTKEISIAIYVPKSYYSIGQEYKIVVGVMSQWADSSGTHTETSSICTAPFYVDEQSDIERKSLVFDTDIKVSYPTELIYTGKEIYPKITITDGNYTLIEGIDYEVSYPANSVACGSYKATIVPKGKYQDPFNCEYWIVEKSSKPVTPTVPSISYKTYVQKQGWQAFVKNGKTSGTVGKALRLEGIKIKLGNASGNVLYRTYVQKQGWETSWKKNNAISGTMGQSKRLEAIEIKLSGNIAKNYDVYYRVQAQKFGWMGWAKNGANAGTAGYGYRLEGIQIKLVKKGGKAPTSTNKAFQKKQ